MAEITKDGYVKCCLSNLKPNWMQFGWVYIQKMSFSKIAESHRLNTNVFYLVDPKRIEAHEQNIPFFTFSLLFVIGIQPAGNSGRYGKTFAVRRIAAQFDSTNNEI